MFESNFSIQVPLQSPTDVLACQFFETFRPDLPQGKSLASFGKYIAEVPRRVGSNKACDLAVKSICLAHGSLLTGGEQSIVSSRIQYGKALVELQVCLNDREQAFSANTLCAIMLLTIYEVRWRLGPLWRAKANSVIAASGYRQDRFDPPCRWRFSVDRAERR